VGSKETAYYHTKGEGKSRALGLGSGAMNQILLKPRLRFKPPKPPAGTTEKKTGIGRGKENPKMTIAEPSGSAKRPPISRDLRTARPEVKN
jgi:hypothetical protein